jgi:hypothetical protein
MSCKWETVLLSLMPANANWHIIFNRKSKNQPLQKQRDFWESVLNPANPTAVVGQDRRTIAFPLPVKELRLEDSRYKTLIREVLTAHRLCLAESIPNHLIGFACRIDPSRSL